MLALHSGLARAPLESALEQLVEQLPPAALAVLRTNHRAFVAWVADPALRAATPRAAVDHVLTSIGPAMKLREELLTALRSIPDGTQLFVDTTQEQLPGIVPPGAPGQLAQAGENLARVQRLLFRLVTFHPDLPGFEDRVGVDRISELLTLQFHADNLLAVALIAVERADVPAEVLHELASAAADFALRCRALACAIVELSPLPFEANQRVGGLEYLLSLPPYDGPAVPIEELSAG